MGKQFVQLSRSEFEIGDCQECSAKMINMDSNQLGVGDLVKIKNSNLKISNPETDEMVCLDCDIQKRPSKRSALKSWFNSSSNDDSGWFGGSSSSGSSSSGSSSSGGGFDFGSFGGFGGGGFSGGGASGGF